MKKHILLFLYFIFCVSLMYSANVSYFPFQEIVLLDSPFKQARETDEKYIMSMDPDRLLAPFLHEAGLKQKAEYYPNWESQGLGGHICGHYLSALSMLYASTGEKVVKKRLDYMIGELHRAQKKVGTGFLGGTPGSLELWNNVSRGKFRAGAFDINKKWVPLYNLHKTFSGLLDVYTYTGNKKALGILIKMSDWMYGVVSGLSDSQMQNLLVSEHGGLNEVFASLYKITDNKKYLNLSYRFSQKSLLDMLDKKEDKLTGMHANTQIPKVIGFKRISEVSKDKRMEEDAVFFWNTVVNNRSVCIGGNSVREHFNPVNDFSSMIKDVQGPETCNTYNMLKLTRHLFSTDPKVKYADYYEKALYNHILSTQEPVRGGFVYFTPMRPGHYRVYSRPQTSMWCCVGTGMENHVKYQAFIYSYEKDSLYVNLFIPSKLTWKNNDLKLIQRTKFPDDNKTVIKIEKAPKKAVNIKIRCPEWSEKTEIYVNGKKHLNGTKGKYVSVLRKWNKGDSIVVIFSMSVRMEQLPDKEKYFSFEYGPVVLASPCGTYDMKGLFAGTGRGAHIPAGRKMLLSKEPVLVGSPERLSLNMEKEKSNELSFIYKGRAYPDSIRPLKFEPFFRIYDQRYYIYMKVIEENNLNKIIQKRDSLEKAGRKSSEEILDVIYAGEQQSEKDHNIEYENSKIYNINDEHFRGIKEWVSYTFYNPEKAGASILFVFNKSGKNKKLMFDGKELTNSVVSKRGKNILETYKLPGQIEKGSHSVKIISVEGQETPLLNEIKLIKEIR